MCNYCLPPSLFPRITKGEMQRVRKWQALLAISLLLLTSSVQGISEMPASDRRTLLDLIVQVIGDSSRESGKVITRRYSDGAAYSAEHHRLSSRERSSPRSNSKRPSEIFARDPILKDKFINHFTAGPVIISAECTKQFNRLYHHTKDCSTPNYYKRCARLLARLAKSQMCSPSLVTGV
ncbi:ALK and LTK ligand 1 [Pyxicephalus adspersus]|uniref:ALK and LTK ligand 1 n=1 Tax=Pyxicephalus adspersus TaxID=30357 RepID=UPI003B5AB194